VSARKKALVLAGWLTLAASPSRVARANEDAVRLVWVRGAGAEECADAASVAERVAARLGRNVFAESAPKSIEGFVEQAGGHWSAHIATRGPKGELLGARELSSDAPDCKPLENAVTLVVALAIDPDAALRGLPGASPVPPEAPGPASSPASPAPPPPLAPPPLACPVARPCPAPETSPPAPKATLATVTLRGTLSIGLLPATSSGAAVAADVSLVGPLSLAIGALFLPEVRTPSNSFGFGLSAGWLGVCARPWQTKWAIASVCATFEAGAIHAVVYDLEPVKPGDQLWLGAALTPKFSLRLLGPLAVEAGVDFIAPITRQAFTLGGQADTIFQQSAYAATGFVGLGLRIP